MIWLPPGGLDLAYASDLATDAMAALGIEATSDNLTRFGDEMAKTASKANTSVAQLGEAILTVGGTAKSLAGGTTELNGIIVGTAEFDNITLPEDLLKAGREYLKNNNRIRKAYEAQVLDLSIIDTTLENIRCGNTYRFVNEFMGLDEELRIMKRTVDIYKPYSPMVEIGDKAERITDISVRTAHLIEYELPQKICALNVRMDIIIR